MGDPTWCESVIEIITLLALYAIVQAAALTTTTKAASNQPRVSICVFHLCNAGWMDAQVAWPPASEIENLIDEFHGLRKKLQTDLSRIQHDIAEYRELSQAVMQLAATISDGMKQFPGTTIV